MKRYVLGDPHGSYKGLLQCFERSNFNKDKDELIVLGDVVDGWPDSVEVIEELLTVKYLISIMGNHDFWAYNWMRYGYQPKEWVYQGGESTIRSYMTKDNTDDLKERHTREYFAKTHFYYIDDDHNVFVHGGMFTGLRDDSQDTLMWDRTLWSKAKSARDTQLNMTKGYKNIFIGHSSIGDSAPLKRGGNIWNLDTGSGWEGRLTIMNIDTEEYWQSDKSRDLYPNVEKRKPYNPWKENGIM